MMVQRAGMAIGRMRDEGGKMTTKTKAVCVNLARFEQDG
jgi:hypothetical protein